MYRISSLPPTKMPKGTCRARMALSVSFDAGSAQPKKARKLCGGMCKCVKEGVDISHTRGKERKHDI
jgi:hypothetical protein